MKKCIKCQVTITKKIKQGMCAVPTVQCYVLGRVLHGICLSNTSDSQRNAHKEESCVLGRDKKGVPIALITFREEKVLSAGMGQNQAAETGHLRKLELCLAYSVQHQVLCS